MVRCGSMYGRRWNADSNPNPGSKPHPNTYAETDAYPNSNPHSSCYPNTNGYSHAHTRSYSGSHAYTNAFSDPNVRWNMRSRVAGRYVCHGWPGGIFWRAQLAGDRRGSVRCSKLAAAERSGALDRCRSVCRRWRNPDPNANAGCNADACGDANSHGHTHAESDSDSERHAHTNRYAYAFSESKPDTRIWPGERPLIGRLLA